MILELVNAGVVLLNLGAGVYNAVQFKKTQGQVAALQADVSRGFESVHAALMRQAHTLNILLRAE